MDESGKQTRGRYLGTEIGNVWWKRYRSDRFGAGGNGVYWFTSDDLCFRRLLTKRALRIPLRLITGTSLATWHAGTWNAGRPIVKIHWRSPDGRELTTGIGFARKDTADGLIAEIARRIRRNVDF